ncbi:MAG: outer membrane protein assembly factor BamE [Gammaproteobacteria bacterium]
MNTIRQYTKALLVTLTCAALTGCGVYKINVQQGNYLKDEKLAQLKVGMTKRQVQYLLGSPIVQDAFHPDRWDYVFSYRNGKTDQTAKRSMRIYFDGDLVESFELPDNYVAPAQSDAS